MTTPRVGAGLDVHAFAAPEASRPLVLCGVTVPAAPGLAGHSDADAGTHALIDAMLGAAALGDLGTRFGVDDPAHADISSLTLLERALADVWAAGWKPGNVDLTLVAQRPRLAQYRQRMRETLAAGLHLDVGAVSVKATTTDQLGSLGRGEGIAAWAVCMLVPGHG